ncbi:FIG005107: hypothetical protein [Pseudoalteromonas luteoviolacea B = ATCC 29581]|nr:FIG005107: hypothetical protein [Pseudoalteromonas luteoviolacea B = ATCC 29581]
MLEKIQRDFANGIRDPKRHAEAFPNIEVRRLKVYQELFYNNVLGFVSSGFPVLKSLYKSEQWQKLVRKFFVNHACHSPYFLDIAQEFLTYLSSTYELAQDDPPFMLELAHYEWMELVVAIRHEDTDEQVIESEQLASATLCLSVLSNVVSYAFPVHQIKPDNQPQSPSSERYYFVVYRDRNDDVQFVQINALTAILLDQINQQPELTLSQHVELLASQFQQFTHEQLQSGAAQIIKNFTELGVVVTKNTQ